MRKLILPIITLMFVITSCANKSLMLSKEEANDYYLESWTVNCAKDSSVIATVSSWEWELYKGKMIQEISVTAEPGSNGHEIYMIARYLHTRYPKAKIEVNYDKIKALQDSLGQLNFPIDTLKQN
jgi:hypothetical protein